MKNTILVVDDNKPFRQLLIEKIQTETDFSVIGEAGDGFSALLQARELKPALVLLDIRMPDLNGLEIARLLKAEHPNVKIIFVTMYNMEEYREATKTIGANGYVLKSSLEHELLPAIKESLS
ncbi:MAG: response regulator transcription factor [Bacteroidota bacterium]